MNSDAVEGAEVGRIRVMEKSHVLAAEFHNPTVADLQSFEAIRGFGIDISSIKKEWTMKEPKAAIFDLEEVKALLTYAQSYFARNYEPELDDDGNPVYYKMEVELRLSQDGPLEILVRDTDLRLLIAPKRRDKVTSKSPIAEPVVAPSQRSDS